MLALIKTNVLDSDLNKILEENIKTLNAAMYTPDPDVFLYVLGNGFVYVYNNIHCLSNSNNKVHELIITDSNKRCIRILDTKYVSRHSKAIISKIQVMLQLINEAMTKLTRTDMSHVITLNTRIVEEFKHEIIKSFK